MQWRPDPSGGFSTADPSRFPARLVEGEYGPENVSVSAQRGDPESLLTWIGTLAERYRQNPELAWGEYSVQETGIDSVLAHRCSTPRATVIALHNFAETPAEVEVVLDGFDDSSVLVDLLVDGTTKLTERGHVTLRLDGYGCRWLRAFPAPGH
jgi:maltose alpha-D-glucosyltransferase/alpha-amylase